MNHETRLAQLEKLLLDRFEGKPTVMEAAGIATKSMISQWRSGSRQFGERAARKIEIKLRLKPNYFEGKATNLSPRALAIAELFDQLPSDRMEALAPIISMAIRQGITDIEVEQKMPITAKLKKKEQI
jgi:transcriptional regulator with XRE-family HTH domain